MLDREAVCLRYGGQEFWIVDPHRRTVKVVRANGQSTVHDLSGQIASDLLATPSPLSELF